MVEYINKWILLACSNDPVAGGCDGSLDVGSITPKKSPSSFCLGPLLIVDGDWGRLRLAVYSQQSRTSLLVTVNPSLGRSPGLASSSLS